MSKFAKFLSYGFIFVIFTIAICRIYQLIAIKKDYYEEVLASLQNKVISLSSAPRGRILDCNGNILVDNIGVKTIVYTKISGISTNDELDIALKLASIINIDYTPNIDEYKDYYILTHQQQTAALITQEEYQKLQNRKLDTEDIYQLKLDRITQDMLDTLSDKQQTAAHIYKLMNNGYKYETKVLKNEVSEEEYAKVIESDIQGVTGLITWERTYPYGDVLKAIFGNISSSSSGIPKEKKEEYLALGYNLNERVGISYLEEEYEQYLKGTKATYQVNDDNTLTLLEEEQRGNDLVLSIDINLQLEVEQILEEKILLAKTQANTQYYNHAYAIISDPNDGSILAIGAKKLNEDTNEFSNIYTNIITSTYTMGSVVKAASQTVGYQYNLIDINQSIHDSCVKLYLVPAKCSFKSLGNLNDITALKYSSNYYQFITAIKSTGKTYYYNMQLNATIEDFQRYRDTFSSYGLGVLTQIDLPGEQSGLQGTKIADDLLLNLSIGQYDAYTPIQLVQYINTIASDGIRYSLHLMKKIVDTQGNTIVESQRNVLNTVDLSLQYFARIKEGFRQVIDGGTGKGYTDLTFNPAGKTGTSQSFYDSDNDNVVDIQTITMTYAMFAPVDNPKYSLVVISPNVSYQNPKSDYMSYINKHISKAISQTLFENY